MNLDFLSAVRTEQIFQSIENFLSETGSTLTGQIDSFSILPFSASAVIALLITGIVFRIFFGKRCNVNQAIATAIGLLFIYCVTVAIYTFKPLDFAKYLSPLPFALFRNDILIIMPFSGSGLTAISSQILSLIILCFVLNILDSLLMTGRSFTSWLILRCVFIILAVLLNLSLNFLWATVFPDVIAAYAPIALLIILGTAIIISLFNPLLCIIFTIANPIFGLLYTFFFSNTIGKQLTKAVISATLLCFVFFFAEYSGFTVISITTASLLGYLPFSLILLFLWYFFDYKL